MEFCLRILTLDDKNEIVKFSFSLVETIFSQLCKLGTINDHESDSYALFDSMLAFLVDEVYLIPNILITLKTRATLMISIIVQVASSHSKQFRLKKGTTHESLKLAVLDMMGHTTKQSIQL